MYKTSLHLTLKQRCWVPPFREPTEGSGFRVKGQKEAQTVPVLTLGGPAACERSGLCLSSGFEAVDSLS